MPDPEVSIQNKILFTTASLASCAAIVCEGLVMAYPDQFLAGCVAMYGGSSGIILLSIYSIHLLSKEFSNRWKLFRFLLFPASILLAAGFYPFFSWARSEGQRKMKVAEEKLAGAAHAHEPKENLSLELFVTRQFYKPRQPLRIGDSVDVVVTNTGGMRYFSKEERLYCNGVLVATANSDSGFSISADPGEAREHAVSWPIPGVCKSVRVELETTRSKYTKSLNPLTNL